MVLVHFGKASATDRQTIENVLSSRGLAKGKK